MRWFFLASCFLFSPDGSLSQVILNEVYYDALGSDEGYEFVELVSVSDEPVSLGAYAIEFHDGASTGWVRIWTGSLSDTIAPRRLFVIGGERVVPPPDALDALGLQNGPDAVRLVRGGEEIDLLGYGELEDPRYYEAHPSADVESGRSLARRADGVDTGDNAADFEPADPSPGRFNVARRDVALRLAAGIPERESRVRAGIETFAFHVFGRGAGTVDGGTVVVRLVDSTESAVRVDVSRVIPGALEASDSAGVAFDVDLCRGYHRIRARAECPGDEREGNDTVLLLRRVGPTPLLVSEVMSHPLTGCPEYVELFNAGDTPYDLEGHRLRDASHASARIVAHEWTIPPGGFAVLTPDSAGLTAFFPALRAGAIVGFEGSWPSLNHTGSGGVADSLVVLDAALVPVDRVAYPPQPSDTRGRSLERVDLFAGEGPTTWVLCAAAAGGSPGEGSPNSRLAPDVRRGITVSPNPFDPWGRETLVALVPGGGEAERAVVTVFSLDGYRVADLGSTSALPSTFVWDGRDAEGVFVLPGIYVLACEFFPLTNGSRRVERVVVGCGRKIDPGAGR